MCRIDLQRIQVSTCHEVATSDNTAGVQRTFYGSASELLSCQRNNARKPRVVTVIQGLRFDKLRLHPLENSTRTPRMLGFHSFPAKPIPLDYSRTPYSAPKSASFLSPPNCMKSVTQHVLAFVVFVFMPRRLHASSRA